MLVVTRNGYRGRFYDRAASLVKSGTRVGMMWVANELEVSCHICNAKFAPARPDDGHTDVWSECPNCHTPFIFAYVLKETANATRSQT